MTRAGYTPPSPEDFEQSARRVVDAQDPAYKRGYRDGFEQALRDVETLAIELADRSS